MATLDNSTLLISGGSGSLGNALIEEIKKARPSYQFGFPKKVIIYSRNEYNQHLMMKKFEGVPWLRFRIGDVRDKDRLSWCCDKVDYVIHAAALKHIRMCEENPLEAVQTNIIGSSNIVDACMKNNVKRAVLVSTDKSPSPRNLYGATKFTAERLFAAANIYSKTCFRIIRYGNVVNSRGSVVEYFLKLKEQGIHEFPITDPNCTRFWMTLEQAAKAVLKHLTAEKAETLHIPRLPSMKITDVARAIDPECTFKFIGLQKSEKLHEELDDGYTSDTNTDWLTSEEFQKLLK
ncbi:hypothetical protein LCGC14_0730470 [marine sediment metagenome]|uniref:Polysaccharide biosynthesis protein CapD-like domain-containing protein n=1 Tax=marine sediment metagenome TaxID=412755 RepID=A0A0F9QDV1_9ZZZZ